LNAGEFSNESRIPMIEPLWVGWRSRYTDSDRFYRFRSSVESGEPSGV
jgi:hypothetical protein